MTVFKPRITETTEDRLQKAINLGRELALKEVLEWLDENFFTGEIEGYYSDVRDFIVQGKFDCKEEMLQSFKDRFNINEPGVYKVEVETSI